MKVKVIKAFADRCTYKMYAVGEIIDLPGERASDAVKKGLVQSAEVKAETAVKLPKASAKTAIKKPVKRVTKKKEA